MGFCSATSKCVLLIINLLFWLCAAVLIYAGVKYIEASDGVLDDVHKKPALVAFGAGGLLFVCGLIGIAGAFAEKKVLLGIFSIFVVATLILFVFTSVTLFTKKDDARNQTDVFLLKQFNHYDSPNLTALDFGLKRLPRDVSVYPTTTTKKTSTTTATTTSATDTTTTSTPTTKSTTTVPTTKQTTTPKTTTPTTTTEQTTTPKTTTPKTTTPTTTTEQTTTPKTTTPTTTTEQTTMPKTTSPAKTTNGTTKAPKTTKAHQTTTAPATTAPSSSGVNSTEFIDNVQSKLECCGYVNYSDWKTFSTWGHPKYVPKSCCNETAANAKNMTCKGMINVKEVDLIFSKGCQKEVDDVVVHVFKLLSWVSIGISLFVLICFCAAMYLMCRKKDDGFNYSSIVA